MSYHRSLVNHYAAQLTIALSFTVVSLSNFGVAEEPVRERAVSWTSSRVLGSPDQPLPYKTERIFAQVELKQPTDIVWLPDAQRWIATQVDGQVLSFSSDREKAVAQPLMDLRTLHDHTLGTVVSTTFHHDLKKHPWCYVCYASKANIPQGRHLVRFNVLDPSVPTIELSSRVKILSWDSSGHSGGSVQFGPDGFMYLSLGDAQPPYPPDARNTGQDLSDLEASILRIDVDHPTPDSPYRIPADNPFVGSKNVRGEIWAFGFRNPWKMAFNPENGDLFTADVGWEMREMIYRVQRGRNYGWSIMEGSQPVKQDQQPDIPITPPIFEHTHLDSRSITGGHFWRSDRLPELKGAYIYGDWMTGKVWALKTSGDQVLWQKELTDTPLQVISFMLDPSGEVLIVGYDGTIHKLLPNVVTSDEQAFPRKLSETGLFQDVSRHIPRPGVIEYEINAHHWADGTHSRQWIALPGSKQLGLWINPKWDAGQVHGRFKFPADTVLAKTVSYFSEQGNPKSEKHIETQLLHLLGDEWRAYNYVWNDAQTEAVLQDDVASDRKLKIHTPDGDRTQTWHHSSRSECLLCHIWSSGTVQGFAPDQLNIWWRKKEQMAELKNQGLFATSIPITEPMASPHDIAQPLEDRARAYLALNCSNCHRRQGGGTANFNFEIAKSIQENMYIDALPAQGEFGIENARVLAPGDPFRSIILYRMLKFGRGHMPQFGSNLIDDGGIRLLHDWIQSMAANSSEGSKSPELRNLADSLNSTKSAIALSFACSSKSIDAAFRSKVIDAGSQHSDPKIRDLFEGYLPEEQRAERLGTTIDEAKLLAIKGSAERGKVLYEQATDVSCRQCHQIGDIGKNIGPDLSGIGTQQTPQEILTSILRPSAKIDAKYRTQSVLTEDGTVISGIVTSETNAELVLSDTQAKLHRIAKEDIELVQPSTKSVMPELLLSGMKVQQAADLLAYLGAQRKIGPLQHKETVVHRTKGSIVIDGKRDESDWTSAKTVGDFEFTWWNEGGPEKQSTDARMLWDDRYLYVSFYCSDKDVAASRTERDSDVFRDDCVEVFASPEIAHPAHYFNLEINALGAQLDEYRPKGENLGRSWNPEGIKIACSIDGTINNPSDVDRGWLTEVAIPFEIFSEVIPNGRPKIGDRWRLNLNRLEDNMSIKSQWSQGDRNIPRFHTPEYFGFVQFME